jgi:lipoprotein-anchoring transpeptidase ErfK/SrfK
LLCATGLRVRVSAFLRHCRLLTVAVAGAMLVFPASAQTGSESQTPSTSTPGSESQTPSTGTTGSESQTPSTRTTGSESQSPSTGTAGSETQPQSQGAPTSSTPANPEAKPASTTEAQKAAAPHILIAVNKPTQTMTVTVDGRVRYRWRVSTGATQYSTPAGSYTPFRMERMHYSREWDNAGMPHAIFFTQRGHSIHGSDNPGLGTPVSHGCVRLTLSHAATLYQLVGSVGMAKTKVVVSGRDPPGYRRPTMPPRQPVGPFGGFFRF